MASATLLAVEDYVSKTWHPDCDFVDGTLVDRHVGERDHSRLQTLLSRYFSNREEELGITVLVEQRVQTSATRFRIPDVCVLSANSPNEQIVKTPPLLCVEILSKDDRMTEMQERIDDYLRMGVPCVWVIDPRRRTGLLYSPMGMVEAHDGLLRCADPALAIPIHSLFPPAA